jgi:hypothetical protein
VIGAEREFFDALTAGSVPRLDGVLAEDFQMIDVMTGSEVSRPMLLGLIGSGDLQFLTIDVLEARTRDYGTTAIVTGRTRMRGRFQEQAFGAHSRYTHVYVQQAGQWRLAAAQGTPIVLD